MRWTVALFCDSRDCCAGDLQGLHRAPFSLSFYDPFSMFFHLVCLRGQGVLVPNTGVGLKGRTHGKHTCVLCLSTFRAPPCTHDPSTSPPNGLFASGLLDRNTRFPKTWTFLQILLLQAQGETPKRQWIRALPANSMGTQFGLVQRAAQATGLMCWGCDILTSQGAGKSACK